MLTFSRFILRSTPSPLVSIVKFSRFFTKQVRVFRHCLAAANEKSVRYGFLADLREVLKFHCRTLI
jgi:hypothetical protein